jgi:hypothetical protein
MPGLRWVVTLSSRPRLRVISRAPYVGFMVNKVALRQDFLRVLRFVSVSIIPYSFVCQIDYGHIRSGSSTETMSQQ